MSIFVTFIIHIILRNIRNNLIGSDPSNLKSEFQRGIPNSVFPAHFHFIYVLFRACAPILVEANTGLLSSSHLDLVHIHQFQLILLERLKASLHSTHSVSQP